MSVVLCSAGLVCILWMLLGRGPAVAREPHAKATAEGAPAVQLPPLQTLPPAGRSAPSANLATKTAAAPAEPQPPTFLGGRLTLDGTPAEGGWVRLRAADGSFESRAAIDFEGRFLAGRVPCTKLSLSFDVPASERRHLLLPTLDVTPRTGQPEQLEIDWTSSQINVRVLDESMAGLAARVEILGPNYTTSLDTAEDGTAKLGLIGVGRFRFRALARGGLQGDTELELEPGADLNSVVIVARPEAVR